MTLLADALLALTVASWAFWLVALVTVRRHFTPRPGGRETQGAPERREATASATPTAPQPAVAILKPVRGVDAGARESFESFFRLEYPRFEILFGVADADDPVLPLLEQLRAEHPDVPTRVVVAPAPGPNRKAHLLEALARESNAPILVAVDSDMRVAPTYLGEVVAALSAPDVGLVTCPYRGAEPGSLAARLEALHMGVTFLPSAVLGNRVFGVPFAMGSTMALRRADLDAIGGFAPLADYLADDYQLGARVAALGRRVVVSRHVVESVLGPTTFRESFDREVRWGRCTSASRPLGHVFYAITFATPLAAAGLLATGFAPAGWIALAGSLAIRWAVAARIARATGDGESLRALPLLPLRDVMSAIVWAVATLGRRVTWRGEVFEVDRAGRLHRVRPRPTVGADPARATAGPAPTPGGPAAPCGGSRARRGAP